METSTEIRKFDEGILVEGSDSQLEKLKRVPIALDKIFKNVLKRDIDYGIIPGTPKPSLWKPGAELLANYFGLVASDPVIESKIEDRSKEDPYFEYLIKQRFFHYERIMGAGTGAANTRETRYAFRWVSIDRVPKELDIETLEMKDRGSWKSYRVPTPPDEIFTLQNTVLKMAKKRAFVDGILSITGASRIFTQDIKEEDDSPPIRDVNPPKPSEQKPGSEKGKVILGSSGFLDGGK